MQNMWYIATTCIITFTKQCTHRFNMYHQAHIILYYTYWMIHYNNFQNFMIHIKYYDTQQIHVSVDHLKHYTPFLKCISKHTWFLKNFTNLNNTIFKYQYTNPRQCRPNNSVCCFFFPFWLYFYNLWCFVMVFVWILLKIHRIMQRLFPIFFPIIIIGIIYPSIDWRIHYYEVIEQLTKTKKRRIYELMMD